MLWHKFIIVLWGLLARTVHAQGPAYIPGDLLVMLPPEARDHAVAGDLHTVDRVPTGQQVIEQLNVPMRTWLLHFDAEDLPQQLMLGAVMEHPDVITIVDQTGRNMATLTLVQGRARLNTTHPASGMYL